MPAYSGLCEVAGADGVYVPANAALVGDDSGIWYGRLTSGHVDWFVVKQRGAPISIRLPTGKAGTVAVSRYTYLLPDQATVMGSGPRPW